MGIHGIYQEIGKGRRVALSKLSSEIYVAKNRPFRLAIDISIWLFQIQSGKGGSNPALRTFYYRLLRLLCLNIHPLFVFDGPNKPLFKRHKRVGGPGVKVSSIPEFLAKQLLKHFGFPMHFAPGEAEAECALLQREGIVDGVLSEDVDTLMFGSGLTLRSWTPEGKSGKTPTHVNVYDARVTKETSGLDREGMVLVAMMSGGDYIPEGIPGCGPKLACEAARAGFGAELCRVKRNDRDGLRQWKERLCHEIRTNESKFFKQKRTALIIPDDFPNMDVLGYYTTPVISGLEKLEKLKDTLEWDMPLDYPSLRNFAKDAFDWRCISGAKKFIRNLAPAMLTRELRLRGEASDQVSDDLEAQEAREADLISAIHSRRNHASTDGELELRISFVPIKLVNIDLSTEEPDDELPLDEDEDSESEPPPSEAVEGECPGSPKKKRGPSTYDPTAPEKIWMIDTFVRIGVPLMVQDYEGQPNGSKKVKARNAQKVAKPRKNAAGNSGGMRRGALNQFAISLEPGAKRDRSNSKPSAVIDEIDLSNIHELAKLRNLPSTVAKTAKKTQQTGIASFAKVTKPGINTSMNTKSVVVDKVDRCSKGAEPGVVTKQISRYDISCPRALVEELDLSESTDRPLQMPRRKRRSPEPASPYTYRTTSPPRKVLKQPEIIDLLSSSPVQAPVLRPQATSTPPRVRTTLRYRSVPDDNCSPKLDVLEVPLPDTVTRRRRKVPLKRHRTAPVAGEDLDEDMEEPGLSNGPASLRHDIFDAMDLASPTNDVAKKRYQPYEEDYDLPSPSMLKGAVLVPSFAQNTAAMTAADIQPERPAKPPTTIDEWRSRSQSITPQKSRFADRLSQAEGRLARGTAIEEEIITIDSSLPTPPLEDVEFDEVDIVMSRKASLTPRLSPLYAEPKNIGLASRPEVSAGAFLLVNKNLRERPNNYIPAGKSKAKTTRRLRRGEANEDDYSKIIRNSPIDDAPRLQSSVPACFAAPIFAPVPSPINAQSTGLVEEVRENSKGRSKSKGKGKFVQPRESLPGAWKIVDTVDLSDDLYYRRAFRMSEVETVDLTGN